MCIRDSINRPSTDYVGLFGYIDGVEIKNVRLEDVNITGSKGVGGLVGYNYAYYGNTTITNSYSTCSVNGSDRVGGLAGQNFASKDVATARINNSYSTGSITGSSNVGGLIGKHDGGSGTLILTNGWWYNRTGDDADICCGSGTCNNCYEGSLESYFFNVSNPPMDQWNFPPWDSFCNMSGYPPLELENVTDVSECRGYEGPAPYWQMDINLSNANASFFGEAANDVSGNSVSYAGDVNGDGYDDLIIGAYGNDEGGTKAGQSYLIFGKPDGWSMDINLSNANASFFGESADDESGRSVSYAGDVNGDGYDDMIIGAYADEGGIDIGQSYLIFGNNEDFSAKTITNLVITNNSDYSGSVGDSIYVSGINEQLYVNMTAIGGSLSAGDIAVILVNSTDSKQPIEVKCVETGANTNEYHGSFRVTTASSNKLSKKVRVLDGSTLYVMSVDYSNY